jgi:hypothetical protein
MDEPMFFGGSAFINARRVAPYEVIAFIGGKECGRAQSMGFLHGDFAGFSMNIASNTMQQGCGIPDAELLITVNGQEVNKKYRWRPGFYQDSSETLVLAQISPDTSAA